MEFSALDIGSSRHGSHLRALYKFIELEYLPQPDQAELCFTGPRPHVAGRHRSAPARVPDILRVSLVAWPP